MKIGITFDLECDYRAQGFSEEAAAEFDSIETIDAIDAALRNLGHTTVRIGGIKCLVTRLAAGERWDLVFNIAEGAYGIGRESQVPALLDAYQIPYTFSDPAVLAICLHKGVTQKIVRAAGVPTADFAVVEVAGDIKDISIPFPLFAKPVAEGTGKGVSQRSKIETIPQLTATCKELLKSYKQPVLVESFLPGREFTVGVLGTGRNAYAVGAMEVHLSPCAEKGCYGYHNKKNWKDLVTYTLAKGGVAKECKQIALDAWRALGCRDAGRIDLRLNAKGEPCFLEVNPLAGIRPKYSDYCILNDLVGLSYVDFIREIINSAASRTGLPLTEVESVASALDRRISA